jgi:tol-pal system protein YbgF
MRTTEIAVILAAFALTVAAAPARAGLFDDDEARARVERLRVDLAEQGKRIETGLNTISRGQIELANQIDALKAELAKLRGQIEVQSYETEAAKKRQTDFYADLDARLRKLETAAAQAEAKPAVAPAVDPVAETRDYEAALTLFKAAKYKEALSAFQDFIKNYGNRTLTASAHYWAASCHYQLHEYAKAAEMFAKLNATWPEDSKAPDAMLGQATSQEQSGDAKGAKKTFEALVEKYPTSSAAQTARLRLKKK